MKHKGAYVYGDTTHADQLLQISTDMADEIVLNPSLMGGQFIARMSGEFYSWGSGMPGFVLPATAIPPIEGDGDPLY